MAKNRVTSGDYLGCMVGQSFGIPYIAIKIFKTMNLDKSVVESYEVINSDSSKSAKSAIGRSLVGGFFLGGVGVLAGGLSAKNRGTYSIAIYFKDGKKSLIEVDDKIYNAIVKTLF